MCHFFCIILCCHQHFNHFIILLHLFCCPAVLKQHLFTLCQLAVNGGCPCNAQLMADVGAPNILVSETLAAWPPGWPTVTNGDQYVIRRCCCSDVVIYIYVYMCISVYIYLYLNIWDSGIFKIIHVKICRVGCDLRCRTAKDYSGASTTFDASRKAGEDLRQNKNFIDILW